MSRSVMFAQGEHYHIYNRGTEKRRIFSAKTDYQRFLALLYASNGTVPAHLHHQGTAFQDLAHIDRGDQLVKISAYCLMPNHFHLVLFENEENGISRFLQKLQTGYTMYFNRKNERTGALFQGTFKARHADNDTYLRYLLSYVHLNPLSAKWKKGQIENKKAAHSYLAQYKYSSYLDHAGIEREEKKILDTSALPGYFSKSRDFVEEIQEWHEYRKTIKL